MNLRIFENVDELIRGAARTIVERADDGTSIALSGGSTPKPLYELLGKNDELLQKKITWVVVDERYVPLSDPQSNAAMIERALFANGKPPNHRFLRFKTEMNDPAATAAEFEREWRDHGLNDLDIVILGMGDDGHTASLFPGTTALAVEDRIATEVWVEKVKMWRVTITKPVIRAAKLRMVLAAGESKREMLKQIRDGADVPIVQATNGLETWWFVDKAATPDVW